MYSQEQIEQIKKEEENIRFIIDYVRTHTKEEIAEDYHQNETIQKLQSLKSTFDNKELFATMTEEEIVKCVKSLKKPTEKETGIIQNAKKIPNQSLRMTLESKKIFETMTEEQIEEYIKAKALNDILVAEEFDLLARKRKTDVSTAISNIRYLTEKENSFKNHIKSKLKELKEDNAYIAILLSAGIFGLLGTLTYDNELKIPVSITSFSIVLAAQTAILGYQYTKEWFDIVNNNEKNIELLKKEGIYDLLMDAINTKKEYEQKYQEEIGRGR